MNVYLILGTVKSEGSLEIFTIWGLLGNFSKIRRRRGSFSLVSALASLCLSYQTEGDASSLTMHNMTHASKRTASMWWEWRRVRSCRRRKGKDTSNLGLGCEKNLDFEHCIKLLLDIHGRKSTKLLLVLAEKCRGCTTTVSAALCFCLMMAATHSTTQTSHTVQTSTFRMRSHLLLEKNGEGNKRKKKDYFGVDERKGGVCAGLSWQKEKVTKGMKAVIPFN